MTRIEKHNAKIMRQAGFKPVHKLSYGILWKRGRVSISTGNTERVTLKQLVEWVGSGVFHYVRSVTSMRFPEETEIL